MTRVTKDEELNDLISEMTDRFGKPPTVVVRMLEQARLRIWANQWQIRAIHCDEKFAILDYQDRNSAAELVLRSKGRARVVDQRQVFFPLRNAADADVLLEDLKSLLLPR